MISKCLWLVLLGYARFYLLLMLLSLTPLSTFLGYSGVGL